MASINNLLSQPVYQVAIPIVITGFLQYWQTTTDLGRKIDLLNQKVDSFDEKNSIRSESVDKLVDNKILLHEKYEEKLLRDVKNTLMEVTKEVREIREQLGQKFPS